MANDCDVNADCTDTVGSYDCSCRSGYEGDGFNCTGYETLPINFSMNRHTNSADITTLTLMCCCNLKGKFQTNEFVHPSFQMSMNVSKALISAWMQNVTTLLETTPAVLASQGSHLWILPLVVSSIWHNQSHEFLAWFAVNSLYLLIFLPVLYLGFSLQGEAGVKQSYSHFTKALYTQQV